MKTQVRSSLRATILSSMVALALLLPGAAVVSAQGAAEPGARPVPLPRVSVTSAGAPAPSAPAATATAPAADAAPPLRLQVGTFTPARGERLPVPDALRIDAYPAGARGYYIVQFAGPVEETWKAKCEHAGPGFPGRRCPDSGVFDTGLGQTVIRRPTTHPIDVTFTDPVGDGAETRTRT